MVTPGRRPPPSSTGARRPRPRTRCASTTSCAATVDASAPIDAGVGGHATSDHAPRPNAASEPPGGLYAHVSLDEGQTDAKGRAAIRVVIVNASTQPANFEASDSRLYVVQGTLGPDGK